MSPTNQIPSPPPPERPTIDPVLPPDMPDAQPSKDKKSLMIALIVSIVLLLAAGGIAWWLWHSKTPTQAPVATQQYVTDDTTTVKTIAWETPATLPEGFTQVATSNTGTTFNHPDGCDAYTAVATIGQIEIEGDPVEVTKRFLEAAGIKVTSQVNLDDILVLDVDGKNRYTFKGQSLDQEINLPGIPASKAHTVVWSKNFGNQQVSLSATCKEAAWATHGLTVEAWFKQFTLKTERT